ncbi:MULTISPECIES: molecular chaperone [unclassified Serratia (in: enterobacteria)]|uniref:fimbrial biogenesis chaperone n=1 Tax=unclassified Serratia (in: enterobacteria) TaxID=2647522 RepID=UPI000468F3F4|nr:MULTISPECIES: molecular chaperone [unclassified Serratia (in: enterobacteria)]
MPRILVLLSMLSSLFTFSVAAQNGGFGINATRLIYPQGVDSISVTVRNTLTSQPYLVQARVSASQESYSPAPFTVRPPLFRLEPSSVNQMRIVIQGASLPADRESVFYLHASAIPASATPQSDSQRAGVHGAAQFGVGNIIKLFYRPASLPSSSRAAQQSLQFTRVSGGLQVSNPSPYFVSFARVQVGEQVLKLDTPSALMLAPFGSHTFPMKTVAGQVRWQTINDEGGLNAFTQSLP